MGGFDVVITGFKLNGKESAARVLERVLGEQPDSAKALAKTFPTVVRRAMAPAEADAVVLALREAGARVELRAAGAALAAPSAPTASAVAGLIAAQPQPASVPVPGAQGMQLGAARIAEPPKEEKKSTGKFILGTLKILLNGPPPPPPQQPAVVIKPAPAPAPALSADEALHATGMRDEGFDDVGSQQALELETDALQDRGNYVSGGRKEQVQRPSLLNIVANIPMRVVRRAKPKEELEPEVEPGALASLESRHPYIWHAFVGVGLLVCLGLSLAVIYKKPPKEEVAVATAHGVPGAPPPEGEQAQGEATLGPQDAEEDGPALHPILKIVPKPMEPALAGILRKQVAGTRSVGIDWGDVGPPKDDRVSCVVISGNAMQQSERARALLATGRRYPMTPMLEKQMRDHMEVMRLADGDPKARYTPLCVAN